MLLVFFAGISQNFLSRTSSGKSGQGLKSVAAGRHASCAYASGRGGLLLGARDGVVPALCASSSSSLMDTSGPTPPSGGAPTWPTWSEWRFRKFVSVCEVHCAAAAQTLGGKQQRRTVLQCNVPLELHSVMYNLNCSAAALALPLVPRALQQRLDAAVSRLGTVQHVARCSNECSAAAAQCSCNWRSPAVSTATVSGGAARTVLALVPHQWQPASY